uniref:Uncharacterized protein n=1 Tax=Pithovirus LCPAC103 TaxID=2506588 RepID=A0A481Z3C1_9VIRU|nr:MAG: uncharacterized protein LCPAC103_00080 [Pithovirus LCPAC103]
MDSIDGVDVELAISEVLRNKITTLTPGSIQFRNVLDLNWLNKQAVQRVYQNVVLIGRLPDIYDVNIGGRAVWLYVKSKISDHHFDDFVIQDVLHMHARPAIHADYFSVSLAIPLKAEVVSQILHLTESTTYNRVSQRLTAACHFKGASDVTFYVIARLNSGEITIEEARSIYAELIPQALMEYQKVEKSVDMRSVATPLSNTLEKYYFSQANTKLADEMARRRPRGKSVTQAEIMLTETTLPSAPLRPGTVRLNLPTPGQIGNYLPRT